MSYIDDYGICITTLLLWLLAYTAILLDTNKWLEIIIYLIYCLWLIMYHFPAKCSNIFICDLIDYVLCILLHSRLILSILGWNRTLLGTPPYWEISLTFFLWYFQMARITMTIEMDAALEYNFVTHKVNLVILDHMLIIASIDD